jgi:hypothetical protein
LQKIQETQDALKIKEQENEALKEVVNGKNDHGDKDSVELELINLKTKLAEKDILIEKISSENKSLRESTDIQLKANAEQM